MSWGPGRLLGRSWGDRADTVITSSTADAGDYQIANLIDPDPDMVMRGTNPWTITITLAKKRPVDGVGLAGHNFGQGTIQTKVYDGATVLIDQTTDTIPPLYGAFQYPGAFNFGAFGYPAADDDTPLPGTWRDAWTEVGADKIELTINADNGLGFLEAMRAKLGNWWQPAAIDNFEWGYTFGWVPAREFVRSRGGALRSVYRNPPRMGEAVWEWLPVSDRVALIQVLLRQQDLMDDIIWDGYPGRGGPLEQQHIALCNITDFDIPNEPNAAQGHARLKLEEVIWNG